MQAAKDPGPVHLVNGTIAPAGDLPAAPPGRGSTSLAPGQIQRPGTKERNKNEVNFQYLKKAEETKTWKMKEGKWIFAIPIGVVLFWLFLASWLNNIPEGPTKKQIQENSDSALYYQMDSAQRAFLKRNDSLTNENINSIHYGK